MLSTVSKLLHVVNGKAVTGKAVTLLCDCDIAILDLKEALFQFTKFVGQVEDNAKAKSEADAMTQQTQPPPDPIAQTTSEPDIKPVQ